MYEVLLYPYAVASYISLFNETPTLQHLCSKYNIVGVPHCAVFMFFLLEYYYN